jgi:hypothetical protein
MPVIPAIWRVEAAGLCIWDHSDSKVRKMLFKQSISKSAWGKRSSINSSKKK